MIHSHIRIQNFESSTVSQQDNGWTWLVHLPVEVGFLSFNVNASHRVQAKPTVECPAILIWPFRKRWQGNSLRE